MNKPIRWKIFLARVTGAILVAGGLWAGYYWFYVMGPFRRWYDPEWRRYQSNRSIWDECQKSLDRNGWHHDAFDCVGRYGDKLWVEQIIRDIEPGDDIASCWGHHKSHALRLITNQDAGDAAGWIAWWEENQSKSQEDWIRDGFRKYGIEVQTPLTRENIVALLKTMRRVDEEKCKVPDYVRYNAFRWLRDSDFDAQTFSLKDIPAKDGDAVLQGLVGLARQDSRFPKDEGLGVLDLGAPIQTSDTIPKLATPSFKAKMYAKVFVPLGIGLLLLWASFRTKARPTAEP